MTDDDASLSSQIDSLQRQLQEAEERIHALEEELDEARRARSDGGGSVRDKHGNLIGEGGYSFSDDQRRAKDAYPGGKNERPLTNQEIRDAIENYMKNSISIVGGGDIVVSHAQRTLNWAITTKGGS